MSETEQTAVVPESGPASVPTGPVYLFDINDLISEHDRIVAKEAEDKKVIEAIEFPDVNQLRARLIEWAQKGFPDGHSIFSIVIQPPSVCADGTSRSLFDYIEYVSGGPISNWMDRLTARLNGMYVQCSYSGNTITFHVFKRTT